MSHMRRHGGYASQATRRGEEWVGCIDCTSHPRAFRQATPVRDDPMRTVAEILIGTIVILVLFVGILAWVAIGQAAMS